MEVEQRYSLNRAAIFLLPKQPVLDWILQVDPNPLAITLEGLRKEPELFLVSQSMETHEDALRWVNQNWRACFENYLMDWFTDESMWPQGRSRKLLHEWFDVHFSSMVWDLANEEFEIEDWGAQE
ncbi:hypothetical protein [Pseudoduganella violaceinigra]|uniref:hypothetical protein n=1 Tax=Pseudoduganella violaceinigra TaxID=246602 RepID=UPI00041BAC86|nr:hypothetical protein [Pseudoduganella violaceinigra]